MCSGAAVGISFKRGQEFCPIYIYIFCFLFNPLVKPLSQYRQNGNAVADLLRLLSLLSSQPSEERSHIERDISEGPANVER